MRHVMGVSWPRSGHHMLVRLLQLYFGPAFHYCEFHVGHPDHPDIERCCREAPCRHRDRIHFTKNHDFDLGLPQIPGQPYIIQYRDFAHSTVSEFETFVRAGGEDSAESFRRHVSEKFGRYRDFMAKWVEADFARGQLLLRYDAVLADPQAALNRAVRLFEPRAEPDAARLAHAVANVDGQKIERREVTLLPRSGVHADRDLRDFRYYDPALFEQIGRLRLSRAEVLRALPPGREPDEARMLDWQGYESVERLRRDLLGRRRFRYMFSRFFR